MTSTSTSTAINGHVSPKITLLQTQRVMESLIIAGKERNGKVAFYNAALSIRNKLNRNGVQAEIMRTKYANNPLPQDREQLRQELGNPMERTVKTLYEIERLWNDGSIHFNCGLTFESQSAWRLEMCSLIFGMSMKTVSWALNIYSPDTCQLITIDCWHCKRIDFDQDKLKPAQYLKLEQRIIADCLDLAETDDRSFWFITYAAYYWECTRQAHNASAAKEGTYQEHNVSCYC